MSCGLDFASAVSARKLTGSKLLALTADAKSRQLYFNYACSDSGATPARTKNVKWKPVFRPPLKPPNSGLDWWGLTYLKCNVYIYVDIPYSKMTLQKANIYKQTKPICLPLPRAICNVPFAPSNLTESHTSAFPGNCCFGDNACAFLWEI